MTPLRWAVALTIAVLSALWLHALATAPAPAILGVPNAVSGIPDREPPTLSGPQLVQTCQDPGRAWCGGDTFSIERYAPDGHYRDDGSIPLAGQGAW